MSSPGCATSVRSILEKLPGPAISHREKRSAFRSVPSNRYVNPGAVSGWGGGTGLMRDMLESRQ